MMRSSLIKQIGLYNTFLLEKNLKYYFDDKRLIRKVLSESLITFYQTEEDYQKIVNDINDEEIKYLRYSVACAVNSFNSYIDNNELLIEQNRPQIISPTIDKIADINRMESFIHELFHIIKSYKNRIILTDKGFILRTGLLYTYYEIDNCDKNENIEILSEKNNVEECVDALQNIYDNVKIEAEEDSCIITNSFHIKKVNSKGRGLEEYFNVLQTEEFLQNYIYGALELTREHDCCDYFAPLFQNYHFRKTLYEAVIDGEKEKFIEDFDKLTSKSYLEWENIADSMYEEICLLDAEEDFDYCQEKYDKYFLEYLNPINEEYLRKVEENAGNCRSRNR